MPKSCLICPLSATHFVAGRSGTQRWGLFLALSEQDERPTHCLRHAADLMETRNHPQTQKETA
jgi:hypothetical protein